MAINGSLGSYDVGIERAHCQGHEPRIISGSFAAAVTGVLPCGLLLSRQADNSWNELAEVAAEVAATGNGSLTDFSGTLANGGLYAGSVVFTDGVEIFSDDGCGNLTGDAGGAGTINYKTGDFSVTFNTAVVDSVDITADYFTSPDGVLDEATDADRSDSCIVVIHGTVTEDMLKVGAAGQAAPSEDLLLAMQDKGIYPA